MTREEMRERVARSICCVNGECYRPDKCHSWSFGGEADAVIAIIRGETLEEAARCADRNAAEAWQEGAEETRGLMRLQAADIAAVIRALKEKP